MGASLSPAHATPVPKGPHVVGCADIMIGRDKEGTLMRLFYPCAAQSIMSDPSQWTSWFLGEEYSYGLATFFTPRIPSIIAYLINWQMRGALIPALWDAQVKEGQYPVIVYSHGLSANRSFYSAVCTELASHGFIVACPEHRDRSACASFVLNDKGEKEFIYIETLEPNTKEYELRNQQIKVRIEESIRTLDVLEKLNKGVMKNDLASGFDLNQLVGKLDLTNPVMSGHSFGGGTTIGTLAKDKRFKIGVALDPWLFPLKDEVKDICPKVSQPVICISTETFQTQSNLSAMNHLPEESATFVTIKGTVHQNQADTPFVLSSIGRVIAGASSTLDPHIAMDINNNLALSFIFKHLGTDKDFGAVYLADKCASLVYGLYGIGKGMLGWDPEWKAV